MRSGKRIFSIIVVVLFHNAIFAQSLYNNGADIKITDGGLMYVDGTLQNESGQIDLDNASLNSELIIQGDFVNNATALGDGYIRLYGDWLNNNIFTAGSGTVFLEGGNQQLG